MNDRNFTWEVKPVDEPLSRDDEYVLAALQGVLSNPNYAHLAPDKAAGVAVEAAMSAIGTLRSVQEDHQEGGAT